MAMQTIEERAKALDQLRRIKGPTNYEMILEYEGGTYLVRYCRRMTRRALVQQVRERAVAICQRFGWGDDVHFEWKKGIHGGRLELSTGAVVRFSGRTQREALTAGPREFIK